MTNRFSRARTRLLQHEEGLTLKKEQIKRSGKILPEETVKIPKIGEWALAPISIDENGEKVPASFITAKDLKSNGKPRARNLSRAEAPYHIRAPKALAEDMQQTSTTKKINFPLGSTTTDLNVIIKSKMRLPNKPLPPLKKTEVESEEPFLPLEIFDDSTYAEFTREELLKHPAAYSKFTDLNGDIKWEKCTCIGYNPEDELFEIKWDKTKKTKKVTRFNIRFAIENEEKFNARLETAKRSCHNYEMMFRFDKRVEQMPKDYLPELSPYDIEMIKAKANVKEDPDHENLIQDLSEEIEDDFKTINNRLEFFYDLQHNPLIPNRDEFLSLFKSKEEKKDYGLVCTTNYSFDEIKKTFEKRFLKANGFILDGLLSISKTFQMADSITFLTNGFDEILTLEEFVKRQKEELQSTCKDFKTSIQETLESVISSTMNDGNNSADSIIYQKMVSLTQRMLHTTLLDLIGATLDAYSSIFTRFLDVEKSKLMQPQFALSLELHEDGKIGIAPTIETLRDQLLSLLMILESSVTELPNINLPILDVDLTTVSFVDCITSIIDSRKGLEKVLDTLFERLTTFLSEYTKIEPIIGLDPQQFAKEFDPEGKRSLNEYRDKLSEFNEVLDICQNQMRQSYKLGIFSLDCTKFKEESVERARGLIKSLLTQMKDLAISEVKELQNTFNKINDRISKTPKTPEELADLREYTEKVNKTTKERQKKIDMAMERFTFLEDFKFEITNEECQEKYKTLKMPNKLLNKLKQADNTIIVEQNRMTRELRENQRQLEAKTLEVTEKHSAFIAKYQDIQYYYEACLDINKIQEELKELQEKQKLYNKHETLFGAETTTCTALTRLIDEFTPIHTLWNLTNDWFNNHQTWINQNFDQTKIDPINNFISAAGKMITRLKKDLKQQKGLIDQVIVPLSAKIDEFKQHIPLIAKLRHPGIKSEHWNKISEITGFDTKPNTETTLQSHIDLNLERWFSQISEIASVAAQEYTIESTLDQMDAEMQQKEFTTKLFRDTGAYVLADIDDVVSTIDDHLVTTQTLLTSPFIGPNKNRAEEKLKFLRESHNTLDAWIECQRGWLYLQPIFTGTSIQQKLHREAGYWQKVDKTWNAIMVLTHDHPEFESVMRRDHIYEDIKSTNELLEEITQGLNAYLESKRLGFPRFFFLSNDELISILSHTKDFDQIQKSMCKLFEYVQTITVDQDMYITHMNDDGLESVELVNPVNGDTPEIEDWLNNFEKEMQDTLKENIKVAIPSAAKKKREAWIAEFPAQVILTVNQILWTTQVITAIKKTNQLEALMDRFVEQLEELTALIRQPLSSAIRQCISCLLILEVHNRDIIQNLIDENVIDVDDFSWTKQLRYYWENDTVMIRSINNDYEYSYEYAGNSTRLVITPLTDRCYQTLLATFKQNMSGAPSGPAGTGKTESVRDCAKALGRPCVVYNCSEEVTPEQMSQFFAGLASSGSWSCFDEFNRINIEVLSVIAQQVRSIQEAVAKNAESFQLDARTIKLNANAAICITMNPGYAGRTELPDNLKALFRPCAMMVPDFVFISEILLFSGGYTTASKLSVKLVALFDLCRKQLSKSYHYDWGLRAMKAILSTAGKAKRNNLEAQEALLLFNSIRDCTKPRLIDVDIPLFEGIMHDVFPEVNSHKEIDDKMHEYMKQSYIELHTQPIELYLSKCNEIYETTLVRHGIMFVGGAMGGKSIAWKALQLTLNKLAADGIGKDVLTYTLNPKAISIPELYGLFDPVTSGWSDGVLSSFIRDCSMAEPTSWNWIIVDGPVDSLWIETMNSLLDDNKVLCLSNNERISLGTHVKMMFEVDDLSQASPATVSRAGMVYFDPITLPWEAIADSWVTDYEAQYGVVVKYAREVMTKYIPKMIQFIQCDGKVAIGSNPMFLVKNMFKIFNCFFDVFRKQQEKQNDDDDDDEKGTDTLDHTLFFSRYTKAREHQVPFFEDEESIHRAVESILIYSIVWSFGAVLLDDSRVLFDNFIKDLMEKEGCLVPFPAKNTCFDYYIDFDKAEWADWIDGDFGIEFIPKEELEANKKQPIESCFIPTSESAALTYLTRLLVEHHFHVLIHGPESSKSLIIKNLYENVLGKQYDCKNLPLANCSTANNVLNVFRSFLHKSHGVFGPLTNQHLVIFFDNIGTVKPEVYGAQPPLELLRQFCDYGGWYNTSNIEFQKVVDTTMIAAMGPAGSGLFSIPERLMRHFNMIHAPKIREQSMKNVLRSLLKIRFTGFNESVTSLYGKTVEASINIHKSCLENLLPIPSKLHYIFSLRNIIRVLKGMLLIKPSDVADGQQWVKLFYHEMMREYNDRFNAHEDRKWFDDMLKKNISEQFGMNFDNICPTGKVVFNQFADKSEKYREITSQPSEVLQICRDMLEEHNRESTKQLDIVIFDEAVDHLSNLNRILIMPKGHAMLVGVKSSGRKSLARLSLHMAEMSTFEIQITRTYSFAEWREDLKNLMKNMGVSDMPTGFILSDSQIIGSYQLEDISNLLIQGEVPNLFERDEKEQIKADIVTNESLLEGDPWDLFMERVKKHLHIILIFSPYGSIFKESMLAFPALRTETTIDWYMPWSRNALESVAHATLRHVSLGEPKVVNSVVNVCVQVHKSVEAAADRFLRETKRFTACTPSRYFELLSTFVDKFDEQTEQTNNDIRKYSGGVEKITATSEQINELSKQLDHDIPILEKKKKEVKEMMNDLKKKQTEVEGTREDVREQSEIASKEEQKARAANQEAQNSLERAEPILQEARDAVEKLDKNSLVSVKTMKVPSDSLRETFEAVCIMFNRIPKKNEDYWSEALSLIVQSNFIKNVKTMAIETLQHSQIDKLKKYVFPGNKEARQKKFEDVCKGSQPVSNLYQWVCSSYDYWWVYQKIIPVKKAADEAQESYDRCQATLRRYKEKLDMVEEQLNSLKRTLQEKQNEENELANNVAHKQLRLDRAKKIMSGLSGETKRWEDCAKNLQDNSTYLLGDTLLSAASLTHLAAFSPSFRSSLIEQWKGFLVKEDIQFTKTFSIESALGNETTIRDWVAKSLPNDKHSIENAIIIEKSKKSYPLLIDPQLNGTKWLRSVLGETLVVLRFDQSDFLQRLKGCVSLAIPVLIENVTLKLDPLIEPILSREVITVDGQKKIALGGEYVGYSDDFRLYLSTKYPNPHYSPEICSQVTLVNFTTTQDGLSDLLMNSLIEVERDDLDKKRIQIMEASAANMKKLKEVEAEILHIVSNVSGDILDDDKAIDTLQKAQKTSANIEQQMAASEKTQKQIAMFREKFSPVASRAALLYFCASDFQVVDPMYQFSLKWFVSIFKNSIMQAEHPSDPTALIASFHLAISRAFYQSVSFSLFSRHKLLFSTLMAVRIQCSEKKINSSELAFLLSPTPGKTKNPTDWLPDDVWNLFSVLPSLNPLFKEVVESLATNEDEWKKYYKSETPENENYPYMKKLSLFQQLLILRIFHLHRVREGLRLFVSKSLGKEFMSHPALNLGKVFKESNPLSPLIFIITPGIDPQDEIIQVAQSMDLERYLRSYSLGRGRGKGAEELIEDAFEKGFWVLLQNCHLSLSWMPKLEHIIDNFDASKVNPRFRLCLVTMSSPEFPIGILYQGSKLIYEIPKGIRENMLRVYSGINNDEYLSEYSSTERKLTFHLSFFHAVVLERLLFGSLGWNIPYEFNPSDLSISRKHLRMFLNEAPPNTVPYESLGYVIGELNYGGRVTDKWDRRLLLSLLRRYFSPEINKPDFTFGEKYQAPDYDAPTNQVEEVINTWPMVTEGTDVGLSVNASTITARNDAINIFNSLIEIQPTLVAASGNVSEAQFALNLVERLINDVPQQFNIFNFTKKFDQKDTINIVLHHEIVLYNKLLEFIKNSLTKLQQALKGLIVMDEELERLNQRVLANKIPEAWLVHSFPSILTLHSYMEDLNNRIAFLDSWIRTGRPTVFKVGAFFHPEEFLTAILQVYARKHVVPFDSLTWKTTILNTYDETTLTEPEDGVYIQGIFLEDAKWDLEKGRLIECEQRELISTLPIVHLCPTTDKNLYDMSKTFECTMYRMQNRGSGALGLPNYIMSIFIPTPDVPPDHWIERSVALFITVQN